ncbi:MAG: AAC(3) family N-acetyltransferase [Clostridia bacterium]|nr:AAC(3) family N-acetyltransferase [Clostridia bacterium]
MKYNKSDVKRYLSSLGIKSDDTVLIHTSYKSVGEIEGGPDAFIDAFCEHLCDGLFIIPTHTWNNVNSENPIYIVNKTLPCIGLLPRIAAFRADGVRSLHPTHSMWVHGVEKENFIAGEELSETPAPVGGAWWRLGERRAKILLIGVGLNRNTYIHAVDEIAQLDDRLSPTPFSVTVIDQNGNETTHGFRPHYNTGSENFGNFERPLRELGALTYGKLCDADVMLVDAAKCRDIILKIYSRADENPCREPGDIPEHLWR